MIRADRQSPRRLYAALHASDRIHQRGLERDHCATPGPRGSRSFGQYDVIAITDMPDHVSAAAIAIAFAGGGACKSVNTVPLLTQEEALQAMRKAGESGYRPATATRRAA